MQRVKILAAVLLLVSVIASIKLAGGVTYIRTLPSNTLFFDSFESAPLHWSPFDTCSGGTTLLNSTGFSLDTPGALEIHGCTAASTAQDARTTIAVPLTVTRLGLSAYMGFTKNFAYNPSSNDMILYMSLEWWTPSAVREECRVGYEPQAGWVYYQSGALDTKQFIVTNTPAQGGHTVTYYGLEDTANRQLQTWYYVKVVCDRVANTWVSVTTPEGFWTCGAGLNNGCGPNNPNDGVLKGSLIGLEFANQNNNGNGYTNFYIDNVLLTDETPGTPTPTPSCILCNLVGPLPALTDQILILGGSAAATILAVIGLFVSFKRAKDRRP